MSQDDLGADLLARHPRGELWRLLDVTVASLTFEQMSAMAGFDGDADRGAREQARARVLVAVEGEVAARLASRWVRWADTFGLSNAEVGGPPREQLAYPYQPATTRRNQDYADMLLPIFDAALGIIGAPLTVDGEADCQALTPGVAAGMPAVEVHGGDRIRAAHPGGAVGAAFRRRHAGPVAAHDGRRPGSHR